MEVEMKIRGLMMDPVTNMPIVILKDVEGKSVLPIWVGPADGLLAAAARRGSADDRLRVRFLLFRSSMRECVS